MIAGSNTTRITYNKNISFVYFFFKDALKAEFVQSKLTELAASLGHAEGEIFPKQTTILVDRGDTGNGLNMPYFKGDLSKFKMDMGMYSTQVIYNNATKESLSLTEVPMQSKKIAVKMTKEQSEKMQEMQSGEQDYEITATTETKKIAGYNSTKYLLKEKSSGAISEVWTTTEIEIPTNTLTSTIKGVKGVPLEFSTNARGMKSKMTFKGIKEEAVTDINMNIPNGFETMKFEDLLTQMGG